MQCPQCQVDHPERARFCEDCGARLELKCPHCGESATPGKRFCASCGGSLTAAPAVPSPQDYTPAHLAERILHSRAALEGERKQVTVLFVDLKGSTELIQGLDPGAGARPARPRAPAHYGCRAPLRGHRQPGARRRPHGPVRRAAGA